MREREPLVGAGEVTNRIYEEHVPNGGRALFDFQYAAVSMELGEYV